MEERYVDSKGWLRSCGCVVGWDPDDLNAYIDRWNHEIRKLPFEIPTDFWDWLSWETGQDLRGFDVLWHSKLLSKVHKIRR